MRILIVEDEVEIAAMIQKALERASYAVDVSHDGEDGLFLGETEPYDAIVLDLGLPVVNGLSVLETWRRKGIETPVLILSARGAWREKVAGLRSGADDYMAKPFEAYNRITNSGMLLNLTALEYKMLTYMLHHQDRVISKTEFTEHLYAQDFDKDSNTLEVIVGRLRKKIGADLIHTHRGQGYSLSAGDGDVAPNP